MSASLAGSHQLTLMIATENSEQIAENIPNAQLLVVQNANHSVHIEQTELVLDKVRDFLS